MSLRTVRWGLLFALLAIAFGFTMGALFGVNEANLKAHLAAEGRAAVATKYGGDASKVQPVLDKSWVYFQRAHLHGGGIGAVAALLCVLLAACGRSSKTVRGMAALAAGLGALGYSVFWLLAGLRAPGLGGTGPAKESLEWLAVPTSGLAIVALVTTIVLFVREVFLRAGPVEGA